MFFSDYLHLNISFYTLDTVETALPESHAPIFSIGYENLNKDNRLGWSQSHA